MFDPKYTTTIGTKVTKKTIRYERPKPGGAAKIRATLLPRDIAGQHTFEKVVRAYTRGSVGARVVVNANRVDPRASARRWLAVARESIPGGPVMLFMVDPEDAAQTRAAERVAREGGADFIVASPGTPAATEAALLMFGEKLVERYPSSHPEGPYDSPAPQRSGRRAKKGR
jgi:hypothetical protein